VRPIPTDIYYHPLGCGDAALGNILGESHEIYKNMYFHNDIVSLRILYVLSFLSTAW